MNTLIDLVFKLLDAIMEEAAKLSPEEAAAARTRIATGIAYRARRIQDAEDDDWSSVPPAP